MENKEVDIEQDAIRYASTQPPGEWNASKLGYIAGATDYIRERDESINKEEVAIIYELVWSAIGSGDEEKNKLINSIRSKLEMADVLIIKRIQMGS